MHRYSDNCTCDACSDYFFKALVKALDRSEKKKAKKRKRKGGK